MSEIDDLIQNFVDEYKILAYDFFVDLSTEIFDDDDDPIEEFEYVRG